MALTATTSTRLTAFRDLMALTRPGVLVLVVLTVPAGFASAAQWPGLILMFAVSIGTALLAGGCSAFNAVWERELDARMARTRDRPLPSGRISNGAACFFATALTIAGLGLLFIFGGPLAAIVGALTWIHYVFVYTIWLKPRTAQSIVIGGAAGATAPVIAEAAALGTITSWSLLLFAIIVLWTPAHFWAIALFRQRDYAEAGFPTMPSTVGASGTRWRMLAYTIAMTVCCVIPWVDGTIGWAAGGITLAASLWFVWLIVKSIARQTHTADRSVFIGSVVQLAVVFVALTVG